MDDIHSQLFVNFHIIRVIILREGQLIEDLLQLEQSLVKDAVLNLITICADALLQLRILTFQNLCLLLLVDNLAVLIDEALVDERLQLLAGSDQRQAELVAHDVDLTVGGFQTPRRLTRKRLASLRQDSLPADVSRDGNRRLVRLLTLTSLATTYGALLEAVFDQGALNLKWIALIKLILASLLIIIFRTQVQYTANVARLELDKAHLRRLIWIKFKRRVMRYFLLRFLLCDGRFQLGLFGSFNST